MTTHQMNLQPKFFNFIKHGTKRIELRLFDEKRQQIQLGDMIEFSNGSENLQAEVIGLLRYDSFPALFEDFDIKILTDASMTKSELLATLGEFYPPEAQAKYGVVGKLILITKNHKVINFKDEL